MKKDLVELTKMWLYQVWKDKTVQIGPNTYHSTSIKKSVPYCFIYFTTLGVFTRFFVVVFSWEGVE